jgi:hypothetical protein
MAGEGVLVCGLIIFPCIVCRRVECFLDVKKLGVAFVLEVCKRDEENISDLVVVEALNFGAR